ncbi:MAG: cbb3-type cytochrome c oxidase subunit 3 [Proteobacteria bacterium]|nr:cbb3-type cytochrome c oxidase subunit 3 [Pseudomonadota bacterium]
MDINDARVLTTVLSLILFIGIMAWTWSARRRAGFDEAARLPFSETDDANTEPAGEKQ